MANRSVRIVKGCQTGKNNPITPRKMSPPVVKWIWVKGYSSRCEIWSRVVGGLDFVSCIDNIHLKSVTRNRVICMDYWEGRSQKVWVVLTDLGSGFPLYLGHYIPVDISEQKEAKYRFLKGVLCPYCMV